MTTGAIEAIFYGNRRKQKKPRRFENAGGYVWGYRKRENGTSFFISTHEREHFGGAAVSQRDTQY